MKIQSNMYINNPDMTSRNIEKKENSSHALVALVVRGEKSPQLRAFSRQPARQRDSNGVGNRL